MKYTGTTAHIGGSVHLTQGKRVEVTSTLFVESENWDYGACLRAEGFSFARFEWDCFLRAKTRASNGWGQTTSLHSQTNSSLHLSNSITECSPGTNQGGCYTIYFESCSHKSIINFNNLSNNKLYYSVAWNWNDIEGEGTMNTLANNVMDCPVWSRTKANSLSSTNIVGNIHSPNSNDGLFYIESGSLNVSDSFIISNNYASLYDTSESKPSLQNTFFHGNTFDASPTTSPLPFTHSLIHNSDWECATNPFLGTNKFSIHSTLLGKDIFVSLFILNG